jgi:hypothetical protein
MEMPIVLKYIFSAARGGQKKARHVGLLGRAGQDNYCIVKSSAPITVLLA